MKKSTAIIIFIVYLASIVMIGFFGMRVKVYDVQKYVKKIEMNVEAEKEDMFSFEFLGVDDHSDDPKVQPTFNNLYKLTIYFDKALTGEFKVDGVTETKRYAPLTLIPKVTYSTGVMGKGESIKYSISKPELIEKGDVELTEFGVLTCFRKTGFIIYVNPASISGVGTGAVIDVYVI